MPEVKLRECVDGSGTNRYTRRRGLDRQGEVMDGSDANRGSRINGDRGACVPYFAMNKDLPLRSKQTLRDSDLADQTSISGYNLVSPGTHGNIDQEHRY